MNRTLSYLDQGMRKSFWLATQYTRCSRYSHQNSTSWNVAPFNIKSKWYIIYRNTRTICQSFSSSHAPAAKVLRLHGTSRYAPKWNGVFDEFFNYIPLLAVMYGIELYQFWTFTELPMFLSFATVLGKWASGFFTRHNSIFRTFFRAHPTTHRVRARESWASPGVQP